MNNNIYAIHSILQKMKDDKRDKFFSLTNLIIQLQLKHSIEVLNVSEEVVEQLQNYSQIAKEDYRELSEIYGEYNLFNKIKNLTSKTTFIRKVGSPFDEKFDTEDSKEDFKKLCNVVALVNLLQKRLKGKRAEELVEYQLLDKLTAINPQLVQLLAIQKLRTITGDDELATFAKEEYVTYDDIRFSELYPIMDSDAGCQIYDLIDLFQ